ncbi:hypothetical protein Z517_00562 [Fonsecaea pedrosoi CBS 271.37]|uniref:Uncharacterized protein n=1 Tax=Fonsecaea pedrosoi CBS 271.37 TaxID=1442368 RepID=A0A0D2FEU8_9EURO|nr:uncharacterized protein Z517_00562 [Fonsecaea pedrosoi CBS 271.37]KIW85172.1 hypothetical protein Z517_00562 [Fonsecaea pedrosoi CBS 271.37]
MAHHSQDEPLRFEDLFLTEKEHYTIRTLSQILKWTESLVRGSEVPHSGYVTIPKKNRDHSSKYKILNSFCQAINRGGSEVIALLPGPFTGDALTVFGSVSETFASSTEVADSKQDLFLTRNPQQDEFAGPTLEQIQYSVQFHRQQIRPDFTQDPVGTYADMLEKSGHKIPFAVVPQLSLALLKRAHAQPSGESGRDSLKSFGLFTMCLGLNRLCARCNLGVKSRNFFHVLMLLDTGTQPEKEWEDLAKRFQDPAADDLRDKDIRNGEAFTKSQKKFMLYLEHLGLIAEGPRMAVAFDCRGRRLIANVLRVLLQVFKHAIEIVRDSQPSKEKTKPFDMRTYRRSIATLLEANRLLWSFFTRFRDQIRKTLGWIACVCELKNATLVNTYSEYGEQAIVSSPIEEPSSDENTPPPQASEPCTATPGPSQQVVRTRTPTPPSDIRSSPPSASAKTPSPFRELTLPVLDNLTDDESNAEEVLALCDIEENPQLGWKDACFRWIELLVTHYEAIENVHIRSRRQSTSISKSLRLLVPRAEIHCLEVKSSYKDRRMGSVNEVLEYLALRLDLTAAQALREWLERHTEEGIQATGFPYARAHVERKCRWDTPRFTGTMHCETIMLTLHALSMDGMFSSSTTASAQAISECLESRNIIVPPDIIDKFKTIGDILAVSKRCCPACNSVVSTIRQLQPNDRRITYPGYHTVWFPIALPPWTPRRIGENLLEELWRAVMSRTEYAYDVAEEGKRVRRNTPSDASRADIEERSDSDSDSDIDLSSIDRFDLLHAYGLHHREPEDRPERDHQEAGDETPRPSRRTVPIMLAPAIPEPSTSPKRPRVASSETSEVEFDLSPTKKSRKGQS